MTVRIGGLSQHGWCSMYEVRVGNGKNSRQVYATEDQIEAVNYARRNLFRWGGLPVSVVHYRPIGSVGRTVPHVVWESRPGDQTGTGAQTSTDEDRALEAARQRRMLMRAAK